MKQHIPDDVIKKIVLQTIAYPAVVKLFNHWKDCKDCQRKIINKRYLSSLYKSDKMVQTYQFLQRDIIIDNIPITFYYNKNGIGQIKINPTNNNGNYNIGDNETELVLKFRLALQDYFQRIPIQFNQITATFIKTAFQKETLFWTSLIPFGHTVNYGKIGEWMEKNCAQAIGQALKKNPLPILIPCHRVLGKNGHLVGFAAGLDLKRKLLDLEKSNTYNGSI